MHAPISIAEVMEHLRKLQNGKSSGANGLPSELLRYAIKPPTVDEPHPQHKLSAHLCDLLNAFFSIPAALNRVLVTPVHKKGSKLDCMNYRPIAVIDPIIKLYSSILNSRLIHFTEEHSLRASSQAGFRPGLSTLHPLFTLQHFIDKCSYNKQPLYGCFLDLKSAYDRVQRPLLWAVLGRLGIAGTFLRAVQSLYHDSTYAINIQGRVGPPSVSTAGVKQGCPLNPTLFGLFLDGLQRYLEAECPLSGPVLKNCDHVSVLKYADDVALLATSPSQLQDLVRATSDFCSAVGLLISFSKSSVMTFSAAPQPPLDITSHGQVIPCVSQT